MLLEVEEYLPTKFKVRLDCDLAKIISNFKKKSQNIGCLGLQFKIAFFKIVEKFVISGSRLGMLN